MGRREQVLDATIEVLVDRGGRGFTHRAVDRAAGVPMGTTSNFFRTREALLLAAGHHVLARAADPKAFDLPSPTTEAELLHVLGRRVSSARGEYKTRYLAHAILLFEAISNPALKSLMVPAVEERRETFVGWLSDLGAADPELGAHLIMMYLRAILFAEHSGVADRIDCEAVMEPLVRGLLH